MCGRQRESVCTSERERDNVSEREWVCVKESVRECVLESISDLGSRASLRGFSSARRDPTKLFAAPKLTDLRRKPGFST